MPKPLPFEQLLPGLAQLQSLMQGAFKAQQGAGHSAPLGGWMQPALTPEQIETRIAELRTVLYWLEQNVHAVKATIEAMEVQRLTLSALSAMNVNMADLAKGFALPDMSAWASAMPAAMAQATPVASGASPQQADGATLRKADEAQPPSAMPDLAALNPSAWLQPLAKAFAWPLADAAEPKEAAPAQAAAPAVQAAPDSSGSPNEAAGTQSPNAAMADALAWWSTATQQFQALAGAALQNHASAETLLGAGQRAQHAMASGVQDMASALKAAAQAPLNAATDMADAPAKAPQAKKPKAPAEALKPTGRVRKPTAAGAKAAAESAPAASKRKTARASAAPAVVKRVR